MGLVDQTKLCCGPFCAECHLAMEKQDSRLAALESQLSARDAEIARLRAVEDAAAEYVAQYNSGNCTDDELAEYMRTLIDSFIPKEPHDDASKIPVRTPLKKEAT